MEPTAEVSTGAAPDPLGVTQAVMDSIAQTLHDRAVQSIVASQLMIQTAMDEAVQADGLMSRGLEAIRIAGEHCRDLIWALSLPQIRPEHAEGDLLLWLARVGADSRDVTVRVGIDPDTTVGTLQLLTHAIHRVAVDALLDGRGLHQVVITQDAEGLEAVITRQIGSPSRVEGPWLRLARMHIEAAGADYRTNPDNDGITIRVGLDVIPRDC
ncbi:MAG: hypothetical protein ACR2HR_09820 [Euzebya sp.]